MMAFFVAYCAMRNMRDLTLFLWVAASSPPMSGIGDVVAAAKTDGENGFGWRSGLWVSLV